MPHFTASFYCWAFVSKSLLLQIFRQRYLIICTCTIFFLGSRKFLAGWYVCFQIYWVQSYSVEQAVLSFHSYIDPTKYCQTIDFYQTVEWGSMLTATLSFHNSFFVQSFV